MALAISRHSGFHVTTSPLFSMAFFITLFSFHFSAAAIAIFRRCCADVTPYLR